MTRQDFAQYGMARYSGVTENGLRVHVFPRKGFQTKYAFFAVEYGGCDLRFLNRGRWQDTPAGVAHYLEHKMFEMPDYTAIEKLSALGARPNAFTSSSMTGYHFTSTENFLLCLEELIRFVTTPYFTEESVAREQGVIAQEIRMRADEPGRRVRTELMKSLYARHPIREGNLGTEKSIAEITPEILYACHEAFYRPDNMVLCCAGDVDPEEIFALAERLAPEKPKRRLPERDYGADEGLLPVNLRAEGRMSVSVPVFLLGSKLPFPGYGRDWGKALRLAELSCELLLGEGSPLYAELYGEGLIDRSFSSGPLDYPAGGAVCAGGRSRDSQAVLGRIADAAEVFRADRDAEERFSRLQKAYLGNFIMALDSLTGLCHTQADGQFCGWDAMELPELCGELSVRDAETFIHDTFRADRLAISAVRPLDPGKG